MPWMNPLELKWNNCVEVVTALDIWISWKPADWREARSTKQLLKGTCQVSFSFFFSVYCFAITNTINRRSFNKTDVGTSQINDPNIQKFSSRSQMAVTSVIWEVNYFKLAYSLSMKIGYKSWAFLHSCVSHRAELCDTSGIFTGAMALNWKDRDDKWHETIKKMATTGKGPQWQPLELRLTVK